MRTKWYMDITAGQVDGVLTQDCSVALQLTQIGSGEKQERFGPADKAACVSMRYNS